MVAGTSRTRMIVASTKTATARPRPIALVMMTLLKANAPVTTMIMAAADVMMPAVAAKVLHGDYSPRQVLGLMKHFDLAVGMRLHFLIFAAMVGTPFLPLPYAGKVFDLAQRLGVPALRGMEREVEGPLLAEVDRLWDERASRAEATALRVAEVCEQARGTSHVTRGVLESIRSRTLARVNA